MIVILEDDTEMWTSLVQVMPNSPHCTFLVEIENESLPDVAAVVLARMYSQVLYINQQQQLVRRRQNENLDFRN